MKRLIIADSHLGQGRDDIRAMTTLLENAVSGGVREIIYLGDAFQYLIGMCKFWTTGVQDILRVWRDTRSAGVGIGIVEGNRDFFLDEPDLASEIDWSARVHDFRSGRCNFRLVHGDLVNRRDLQYRFWSTLSKSTVARMWARLLPRAVAVGIVRRMEAHLATTNRKFRYTKPIGDLKKSAVAAWGSGIDVVFWGHFHTPWHYRVDGHEALIIPAWLESRVSVLIEDGAWSLVDDDLQPRELALRDASTAAGGNS